MQELFLIRHGESQYNALLTDNLDSSLTDTGKNQVLKTAKFLKKEFGELSSFSGITSPYLRCLQTSRIFHEELGIKFTIHHGPREIMTKYETVIIPERSMDYPEFIWKPCTSKHWKQDSWQFKNETMDEFIERMKSFTTSECNQEKLFVVSHGTPVNTIHDMLLDIERLPSTIEYVKNASVTYIKDKKSILLGHIENN